MSNLPVIDFTQPVLTVDCHERKGIVTRNVYPLALTYDNLYKFWEKARRHRTLFTQEIQDDFNKFCSVFLKFNGAFIEATGLLWVVDDFVGVLYITDIFYPFDANVHYTWFDARHEGRDELVRQMIDFVFKTLKFNRLSCQLPVYVHPAVKQFVKKVGFRAEGKKALTHTLRGEYYDSLLYGIVNPALLAEIEKKKETKEEVA